MGEGATVQIWALAIGIALGVLPVALGVLIGAWMTRRQQVAGATMQLENERAQQFVRGLLNWANAFAGDVSQYRHQVEDLCRHLEPATPGGSPASGDLAAAGMAELLGRLAHANSQLQEQLHTAELNLSRQAEQLTAYLSQARTDALTGLPNRRGFDEELARRYAQWQRHAQPLSVILLDVDHFKQLNDRFGHAAGDAVLQGVARVLDGARREMDLAARYGGEEFAIILPETNAAEACWAALRIGRKVAESRHPFEGNALGVTVSCGVAQLQSGEEIDAWLKRADAALYASKAAGRNCGHVHTGARCEPIGDPADRGGPPTHGGDFTSPRSFAMGAGAYRADDEASPADFDQLCHQLRDRLLEQLGR